jgi:hypothetical protein
MKQNTGVSFAQINFLNNGEVLIPYEECKSAFPHVMLFQGLGNVRHYHGPLTESE